MTIVPGHLDWAGIAAIKKAYGIFQRARISYSAVGRCLPSPHALVGTDWR